MKAHPLTSIRKPDRSSWWIPSFRTPYLLFALAFVLIAAVACSSESETRPVATNTVAATATEIPAPTATTLPATATAAPEATPTESPTINDEVVLGTGLTYGDPNYDFSAASFNSYWYSRYTLGNVVMMSGLGATFMPPQEAVMGMVEMVDQGPESGEHVTMPANAALLRAVFAGGDPQFVSAFNGDPMDLSNFRWDPEKMDTTITPAAQAQTIIKELEWAKFFNSPGWAGAPDADFGAMDRFKGMVMYAGAAQQIQFALQNMRNEEGLYVAGSRLDGDVIEVVDSEIKLADQYQMLQALADFRLLLQQPEQFNGVYANADLLAMVGNGADALLKLIAELTPTNIQDLGLGTQALAWYAASAEDTSLQTKAITMLEQYGDALLQLETTGVIDSARSVRGLLEAARVLNQEKYYEAATNELSVVLDAYHPDSGKIDGVPEIADWEVGDILGALNSAIQNGGHHVDNERIQNVYAGLFESLVSIGGLMQSRVPVAMEVSPFELERMNNDILFAHPSVPTPDKAGGEFGTAAVHASEFAFDESEGRWVVTNSRFDTAGAMHTSNEMMWTFGIVSAFPEVDLSLVTDFPEVDTAANHSHS